MRKLGHWVGAALAMSLLAACGSIGSLLPEADEGTTRPLPSALPHEHVAAQQVLAELAAKAVQQPGWEVEDDQLIYVRTEETAVGVERVHELWVEPDGLILRRLVIAGGGDTSIFPRSGKWASDDEESVKRAYAVLAERGPSVSRPTRSWIAQLPEHPAELLAALDIPEVQGKPNDGRSSGITDGFHEIMSKGWPLFAPSQREPLYMALAQVYSVGAKTTEPVQVGGRKVYVIYLDRGEVDAQELLFDPVTGLPVGTRSSPQVWSFWDVSVVDK